MLEHEDNTFLNQIGLHSTSLSKTSYKETRRSGDESRGRPKSISDGESRRSQSSGGGNGSERAKPMHMA